MMNMDTLHTATTWAIDPVHTNIRFSTRYLLITSISGMFREFEGTVSSAGSGFANSEIRLSIYTRSLCTGNEERDKHLRSADFFDVEKFPVIQFRSTQVTTQGDDIHMVGQLTIKGLEHEISFTAKYTGHCTDDLGNTKAGFEMDTRLNRKDFDIAWNLAFNKGAWLLADEVKVHCDLQLLRLS
jgi:polyisoprenoid-binding protein YceI